MRKRQTALESFEAQNARAAGRMREYEARTSRPRSGKPVPVDPVEGVWRLSLAEAKLLPVHGRYVDQIATGPNVWVVRRRGQLLGIRENKPAAERLWYHGK